MSSSQKVWDVAVIGGGITGAAVARDAALRGFSTALFEKGDYGSGTSAKTTRLIHGGLRYLEYADFALVRESLRERDLLMRQAGHLLRPLPILLPSYRGGRRGLALVGAGMFLYDLLSPGKSTPHCTVTGRAKTLSLAPSLDPGGLRGAGLFYDCQMPVPERFVLENIAAARRAGAVCRNYCAVTRVAETPEGFRLDLRDETGVAASAAARVVVNAAGPWADRVGSLYRPDLSRKVYATKGAHLVLAERCGHGVFTEAADGRLVFTLPMGVLTLVGATDTVYDGTPEEARADEGDIAHLLETLGRRRTRRAARAEVLWTYAGVRPLIHSPSRGSESALTRRHALHREGPGGRFLTIVGGKFTIFRQMAEDTVDAVCAALGEKRPCPTRKISLCGESGCDAGRAPPSVPPEAWRHLASLYGPRAGEVLAAAGGRSNLLAPLVPGRPDLGVEVAHAVSAEDARHIGDVLLRRLRTSIDRDRGLAALDRVAALMAEPLGWGGARIAEEKARFLREAELASRPPSPGRDRAP